MSPLLKLAIVSGAQESLRLQIARGSDINSVDEDGKSPLMLAAGRGDFSICLMLLKAGAQLQARDRFGRDALAYARTSGHVQIVELLTPQLIPPLTPLPESDAGEASDTEEDTCEWEAEEEVVAPEDQVTATDAAGEAQAKIAAHTPTDDYGGWDDVDIDLPEEIRVSRRRRGDLHESELAEVRLLIQSGLETGRILLAPLIEQIHGADDQAAREMRTRLEIVCGDLGIVIEDDKSYSTSHAVADVLDDAMQAVMDEAMAHFELLGARYVDPLFQFTKEMGRYELLTKEQEQDIGRDMELAIEKALRAFACHPSAINALLDIASGVEAGEQHLSGIADTDPSPPAIAILESESEVDADLRPEETAEIEEQEADQPVKALPAFLDKVTELKALITLSPAYPEAASQIVEVLMAMRLRWSLIGKISRLVAHRHPELAETTALSAAVLEVRDAQDRFFHANLRLVFATARKYSYHRSLPLSDLVQEGCIGLMKSTEKFQYRRGYKFSTYAMWWIKQAITRALADQERQIRLPVHMIESLNVLNRATRELEKKTGELPSAVDLSEWLSVTPQRITALRRFQYSMVSLDEPDTGLCGKAIGDTLVDPAPRPEMLSEEVSMQRSVRKLMESIDPRGAKVISMRFGISDDQDMTLEEVGRTFGVTRERIRQIEAKALRKFRHPTRLRVFEGYVPESWFRTTDTEEPGDADPEATLPPSAPPGSFPKAQPRPSRATEAATVHDPVENWAADAIQLAGVHGLRVVDSRATGDGLFVELETGRDRVRRKLQRELKCLGFEYLPGRGFWRA